MKKYFAFIAFFVFLTARAFDVAAIVWPAYQPEPRWAELGIFNHGNGEWQNGYEAKPKFKGHYQPMQPLWGYENEADPVVVARKIDAALAAGINVFVYDWYWYQNRPFLENALNEGFLKAPNNERMGFYLMWANHNVGYLWNNKIANKKAKVPLYDGRVSYDEFTKVLVPRFIAYFKKPNYYQIDGKPVFWFYLPAFFVEGVGGMENAKKALDFFRSEAKKAGFKGVHLQFTYATWMKLPPVPNKGNEKESSWRDFTDYLGADSITCYNWNTLSGFTAAAPDAKDIEYSDYGKRAIAAFDKVAKLTDKDFIPNVTLGWDNNARFPSSVYTKITKNRSPELFEKFLRQAKAWGEKNLKANSRLIVINAWNEWTEGAYFEPDTESGYGYLNACARVFGGVGQATEQCAKK